MKLKKVKPCGKMILIKLVEQKKKDDYEKKGALFIPTGDSSVGVATTAKGEKKTVIAYVDDFGPDVDQASVAFKKGDEVMYNSYDLVTLGDDEGNLYGLTKIESILAVVEAER